MSFDALCKVVLVVFAFSGSTAAFAAEAAPRSVAPQPTEKVEPVRISILPGGSFERYTGENQVTATAGRNLADARHVDLDLDATVYLRPTSPGTLFGIALDLAGDSWKKDQSFARIGQVFLAAKAQRFFSDEIGRGFYAHGDLGLVAFSGSVGVESGRTTQSTTTVSPLGFGLRVGAGYAFKVGDWVSLLANVDYGFRTAGASTSMPVTLSGGILF